jgi:hypothetical protein
MFLHLRNMIHPVRGEPSKEHITNRGDQRNAPLLDINNSMIRTRFQDRIPGHFHLSDPIKIWKQQGNDLWYLVRGIIENGRELPNCSIAKRW